MDRFIETDGAKYPKATVKLVKDKEVLPDPLRLSRRAVDPSPHHHAIESTFATVRLRTHNTKGAGSREAGLTMAYKLLDAAQVRWRCVNAPALVALVRAGSPSLTGSRLSAKTRGRPVTISQRSTTIDNISKRYLARAVFHALQAGFLTIGIPRSAT